MIAQLTTVDPKYLLEFLMVVGFFLSTGASLKVLLGQRRAQKREISFDQQYVTLNDCQLVNGSIKERVEKLETGQETIRTKLDEVARYLDHNDELRSVDIHNRLNTASENVKELMGTVKRLADQVDGLDVKMDNLSKVIR
jgi:hypothetical protein